MCERCYERRGNTRELTVKTGNGVIRENTRAIFDRWRLATSTQRPVVSPNDSLGLGIATIEADFAAIGSNVTSRPDMASEKVLAVGARGRR
jgi:hypothetical protein